MWGQDFPKVGVNLVLHGKWVGPNVHRGPTLNFPGKKCTSISRRGHERARILLRCRCFCGYRCEREEPLVWERKEHIGEALALVLLFLLPSGTPSAVSRLCREGLLGPRPHPDSGMVRWKVGSLESELWSRGLGRRVPDSDPGLNGTGIGIGSYCFFLLVSYAGSEIEGGEGC